MQWNTWFKEDIKNKLAFLQEINADIYCLQELNVNEDINEFELLKSKVKLEGALAIADTDHGGQGNAVLSKFPIESSESYFIKEPVEPRKHFSDEGRVYLETKLKLKNRNLVVGTTHMSYTDAFEENPLKKQESDNLLKILKDYSNGYVFAGDLNTPEDSLLIKKLERLFKHAGPDYSEKTWTTKDFGYNGFKVNSLDYRLDYVFATRDIKVVDAKIIQTKYSDHLPILAEIYI